MFGIPKMFIKYNKNIWDKTVVYTVKSKSIEQHE
jgi:hypothetical protein